MNENNTEEYCKFRIGEHVYLMGTGGTIGTGTVKEICVSENDVSEEFEKLLADRKNYYTRYYVKIDGSDNCWAFGEKELFREPIDVIRAILSKLGLSDRYEVIDKKGEDCI